MCGIIGIYGKGAGKWADRIPAMLGEIRHRGPDDLGTFVAANSKTLPSDTMTRRGGSSCRSGDT